MFEQALNGVQVDAGLEQMSGKRMTKGMNAAHLGDVCPLLRYVIDAVAGFGAQWTLAIRPGEQLFPVSRIWRE